MAGDWNSAGSFRNASRLFIILSGNLFKSPPTSPRPSPEALLVQKCRHLLLPKVLSPEWLVFLDREPQVRLHVDRSNSSDNEGFYRRVGVVHLSPGRHNCEAVDEQQGQGTAPANSQLGSH